MAEFRYLGCKKKPPDHGSAIKAYRGTSLVRNCATLGAFSRTGSGATRETASHDDAPWRVCWVCFCVCFPLLAHRDKSRVRGLPIASLCSLLAVTNVECGDFPKQKWNLSEL